MEKMQKNKKKKKYIKKNHDRFVIKVLKDDYLLTQMTSDSS